MTTRTSRLAALGAAAALVLTGCGVHPGDAAVVGSVGIGSGEVDAVASSLCAANVAGGSGGAIASRGARQGALQVLVDSELSRQFGRQRHVQAPQSLVSAAVNRNAQTLRSLPADRRAAFRQALTDYAEGQLTLIAVGKKFLEGQGASNVTETQAVAAGRRLRATFAKSVSVTVDPRYGTWRNGNLRLGSGSLSAPVSAQARSGQVSQPSQTFVASLPASQQCS